MENTDFIHPGGGELDVREDKGEKMQELTGKSQKRDGHKSPTGVGGSGFAPCKRGMHFFIKGQM